MTTNIKSLSDLTTLLTDVVNDSLEAMAHGGNIAAAIFDYENLLPDILTLLPEVREIPAELKTLTGEDYKALVLELVGRLHLPEGHVKELIAATLPVFCTVLDNLFPQIKNLADILKKKQP